MLNVETIRSIWGRRGPDGGWGGGGEYQVEAEEEDTLYYDGCVRTRMTPASEADGQ